VVDCPGERDAHLKTFERDGCPATPDGADPLTHDMVVAGAKVIQEELDAPPFLSRSVARAVYIAMEKTKK